MADKKISDFTELTTVANDDLLPVVDVSDTSQAAAGTNKKVTRNNLLGGPTVTKAWVNFWGTGTVNARGSHNISGVLDNGAGNYQILFATGFINNANYSVVASSSQFITIISGLQSGSFIIKTLNSSFADTDADTICASVFSY